MPKRIPGSGWTPKMRPHTGKDGRVRARVRINGHDHYLGEWGSEEAELAYREFVANWLAGSEGPSQPPKSDLMVAHLVGEWIDHVNREYRYANGKPTSELYFCRLIAGYVSDECGHLAIAEMRPKHLEQVRQRFLAHRWTRRRRGHDPSGKPLSRKQVNEHVRRVVRIFRWGVSQDLVPPEVLHRLKEFPALFRGRTTAPDHAESEPIDWSSVAKTVPFLTHHASACVQVIWLTGARSGEICRLRPEDIDRSERWAPEWLYRPKQHKTSRLGKQKAIWFGPQAQAVLSPFLSECEPGVPIFKTRDEPRAMRFLAHYTPDSLARVVAKACRKAGVPHWCPRQLRAGRATEVEAAMGLEPAAAVLGDRLDVARHHYAKSREVARSVARQMG